MGAWLMRLGLGPVFAYEWLTTARNWRVYAMRVLFGLGLLLILWMVAASGPFDMMQGGRMSIQQQAEAGRAFAAAIISTQLTLMLLIAPAATAGTLCLDKARGTLSHVFTTDLTNSEIILGKLGARLLPALGLLLSTLGVMAICTLMGGIDPRALTGAILVTLGVTVFGASLALALSVWAKKTHEVVMASYLILIAWLAFYPFWLMMSFMGMGFRRPPEWLELGHPFFTLLNVRPGEYPVHRHAWFLAGCLVLSALMMAVAVLRVRVAAIKQMNRPAGVKRRAWLRPLRLLPGPSLDGNPVLWREWHRARPSRWTRAIWWVYALASIGFTSFGVYLIATSGNRNPMAEVAMIPINGFQVAIGLLLMSVAAATSLADERARGSLDVLLTTSLPTRSIVWGKWWGAYRLAPMLAIPPLVLGLCAAWWVEPTAWRGLPGYAPTWTRWLGPPLLAGLTLAYAAAITSFGLVAATWIQRQDRAVMATVAMYLAMSVAIPILFGFLLQHGDEVHRLGATCISPWMGLAYTGGMMVERHRGLEDRWAPQVGWATFWILANLTFAALLLKLELSRFNHKLGRTPDEGMTRRTVPPAAMKPHSPASVREVVNSG